jgi:hypothetical protein
MNYDNIFREIFLLVLLLCFPLQTFQETKIWDEGAINRLWETDSNWIPSGAPKDGDDVIINVPNVNIICELTRIIIIFT